MGTANGSDFKHYQLFYGKNTELGAAPWPLGWIPIGEPFLSPVQDGLLGTWDIRDLPDGTYVLRLVATSNEGFEFEDLVHADIESSELMVDSEGQYFPSVYGDL